jgi:hypothetical protein
MDPAFLVTGPRLVAGEDPVNAIEAASAREAVTSIRDEPKERAASG